MKYSPCLRKESDLEETFFPQSDLTVSFPAAARATSGWGEELRAGTAVLPGSCLSFLKNYEIVYIQRTRSKSGGIAQRPALPYSCCPYSALPCRTLNVSLQVLPFLFIYSSFDFKKDEYITILTPEGSLLSYRQQNTDSVERKPRHPK